jgi:hypothetical protein
MRALLPLLAFANPCVPVLETPHDTDVDASCADWSWEAPANDWPQAEPPCLVGEGFYPDQVVPDFRLVDQRDQTVSLWQFYGMVVFLDVSTIWCAPCRELGSQTEDTWSTYRDQGFMYVTLLAQDNEGNPPDNDDLNAWGDTYGITSPILGDPGETYASAAVPDGQYPTTVMIGRDMKVRERVAPNDAAVRTAIEAALAE